MKKICLSFAMLVLTHSPVIYCVAQEKGMTITSGGMPFVSLEEKQQQALAGKMGNSTPKASGVNISFRYAANKVTPGVVHILSTYKPGFRGPSVDPFSRYYDSELWPNTGQRAAKSPIGSASGVILSNDGYIVTNYHVVSNTQAVEVILHDQRAYPARVVGIDSLTDLALLKIAEKNLSFVAFGSTDSVAVGDWALAIGNPLNLSSTVTAGIISAKSRNINTLEEQGGISSFIQTDAVMNDGNSGGALVDINGKLIGINTGIITPSGNYTGYSFAIPVEVVKKVSNDLLHYGSAHRGYMGVYLKNVADVYGVRVDSLVQQGAAMQAGLRSGDIITGIDNRGVETVGAIHEAMILHHPGDKVTVTVVRKGKEKQLQVVLNNQEETATRVATDDSALLQLLGIEITEIPEKEKELLHVKGGIRVIKIRGGKIYRSTSIEPGFIITEINNRPIASREDFFNALKNYKGRVMIAGIYPDYPEALYYAAFTLQEHQ